MTYLLTLYLIGGGSINAELTNKAQACALVQMAAAGNVLLTTKDETSMLNFQERFMFSEDTDLPETVVAGSKQRALDAMGCLTSRRRKGGRK